MKKLLITTFLVSFLLIGCNDKDYSGSYSSESNPELIGTVEKSGNFYKFDLHYKTKLGDRAFTGEGQIQNSKIIKDGVEMGFIDDKGNIHVRSNTFIKK